MQFPNYTPPQLGPNPYQIAGQAAMQLGQQVGEFGENRDKMRMAYADMVEKRRQKILDDERAAEALRLQQEQAGREREKYEREADALKRAGEVRGRVSQAIQSGQPFTRQQEADLYLSSGLDLPQRWATPEPTKPDRFSAGGGYYEIGEDGNPRQLVAPAPDDGPAPQIIQTNEGVFRIDKATGQAVPVTGPSGTALGGKKSFAPQEIAQAKGSFLSSQASLDRLAQEARAIMEAKGLSRLTGLSGKIPVIPGTSAADARARLETLKSQAGFAVLQNMRDMSKTGGALGNVSNFEVQALQNNLSALDTDQSDDAFIQSLQRIVDYAENAKARLSGAYKDQYGEVPPEVATQNPNPGADAANLPRPAFKAEYDALPSGSMYIGSDGVRRRKR